MTRSSSGMLAAISVTRSRSWSRSSVLKWASVIRKGENFTSRVSSDASLPPSIVTVPISGAAAPAA